MILLSDIRRGTSIIREDAENSPSHVTSPSQSPLDTAKHNMYHICTLASDLYQGILDADEVDQDDVGAIQKVYHILSSLHDKTKSNQEYEGIQNYP